MATRIKTVKVKFKDGFKLINESDFDEKEHERFDETEKPAPNDPDKDLEDSEEPEELIFGDYRIEQKGGGYKNVVHIPTSEVQNEKGLKEEAAVALAKELAAKDEG